MNPKYMISTGIGKATTALNAFDRALMNSDVGNYNLIKISSILPKGAEPTKSLHIEHGTLLPVAYAELISEPCAEKKTISAAVAIGRPKSPEVVGVIMEWSDYASEEIAQKNVTHMILTAMKDRNIKDYDIEIASISTHTSINEYVCAFACVAIIDSDI